MLLYMPTAGKNKLSAALASGAQPRITIGSFRIGEDFGFTPNPAYGVPEPFSVYNGGASDMRGWYVAPYYLALQCILPHNVGDFSIGNVVIYDTDGVPIVGAVSNAAQSKFASVATVRAGNHVVLTLGLYSASKKNLASAILLNAINTNNAAISRVQTEEDLAVTSMSRIGVANVTAHTSSNGPVAAYKIPSDIGPDTWVGMPLYALADAASNTIRGGVAGDGYA